MKTKIKDAAIELLQLININQPPIPVERLAKLSGVQIRYQPFEGQISGLFYQEGALTIIGVNSTHPETRQRFTIAHELGHMMLHNDGELHVDQDFVIHLRNKESSQATNKREIDANNFAAELLMPEDMLKADWEKRDVSFAYDYENDEYINKLAKRYKVSLQAMIFRLANLGYISLS